MVFGAACFVAVNNRIHVVGVAETDRTVADHFRSMIPIFIQTDMETVIISQLICILKNGVKKVVIRMLGQ